MLPTVDAEALRLKSTRYKSVIVVVLVALVTAACSRSGLSGGSGEDAPPEEPVAAAYTWQPRQLPLELAVSDAAMCFDEARGVCVSLGGYLCWGKATSKTHTWDGEQWRKAETLWMGGKVAEAAMAYDSRRKVAVAFGGKDYNSASHRYTWEWDGQYWRTVSVENGPPARHGHCMAYDSARGVTVMFGGYSANSDVWEWDGANWKCVPCTVAPRPYSGAMAYDMNLKRCIFYGGRPVSPEMSDTWEWDGVAWRQFSCAETPGDRAWFAMAYDHNLQGIVMVGEQVKRSPQEDKTWVFRGGEWKRVACSGPLRTCARHALAFDSRRGVMVMHGGEKREDDTWEFDGIAWREVTGRCTPRPDDDTAMCYDSARRQTLLLGVDWHVPEGQPPRGGFWAWNGARWSELHPKQLPTPGQRSMVFDEARAVVVCLVACGTLEKPFAEVWEWNGREWFQVSRHAVETANGDRVYLSPGPYDAAYDPELREILVWRWLPAGVKPEPSTSISSWNGKRWAMRVPRCDWPPCVGLNYAYDPARARHFVYGEALDSGSRACEFDGVSWRDVGLQFGPVLAVGGRSIVADSARGRILLFGGGWTGHEPRSFDHHWEWDGVQWHQPRLMLKPSPRSDALMAFDTTRKVVVLFGGRDEGVPIFDTWEYGPAG